MDNTTAYLAVLARIMQEERAETTTGSWEHYEKLYALVHTDLTTQPANAPVLFCVALLDCFIGYGMAQPAKFHLPSRAFNFFKK